MKSVNVIETIGLCALTIFFINTAIALEPVNPNLNQTGRDILNYLENQYNAGNTVSGANTGGRYPSAYQTVGRRAAHWNYDLQWFDDSLVDKVIADWQKYRPLITCMWHWSLGNGFMRSDYPSDFTISQVTTPGGLYYDNMIAGMDRIAGYLQRFQDAGVCIIFRPLHENGGGWFWWSDKNDPEGSAELWRMMFDYFKNQKGLNNLIWEYNIGQGIGMDSSARKPFYPGDAYCDFISVDMYDTDYETGADEQWWYWDYLAQITPNKMIGCGEGPKLQNPDYMAEGYMPQWLTSMPWYGCPYGETYSIRWGKYTFSHPKIITLDRLPRFGSGNLYPEVGVVGPEWQTWTYDADPVLKAHARDRDGSIAKVEFYAEDTLTEENQLIGTVTSGTENVYSMTWIDMPDGFYRVTAVATDNGGHVSDSDDLGPSWNGADGWSNFAWVTKGYYNIAKHKTVAASSESSPAGNALDDNYETAWNPVFVSGGDNDSAWIQVDLGASYTFGQVILRWGWRYYASDFDIDVSSDGASWTTVFSETGWTSPTDTGPAAFCPFSGGNVTARYVRARLKKQRADNAQYASYDLAQIEVPIPLANVPSATPSYLDLHNRRVFWDKKFERTVFGTPGSVVAGGTYNSYREDYYDVVGEQLCARVEFGANYGEFYLQPYDGTARDMSAFSNGHLHFYARADSNKNFDLLVQDNSGAHAIRSLPLTSQWQEFNIPISEISAEAALSSIEEPFCIAKNGDGVTLYLREVYWSSAPLAPPAENVVLDSSFSQDNNPFPLTRTVSRGHWGLGWYAGDFHTLHSKWQKDTINDRAMVIANYASGLAQVIDDRRVTAGQRMFSFRLKNVEGGGNPNYLAAAIYGLNNDNYSIELVFEDAEYGIGPINNLGPVGDELAFIEINGQNMDEILVAPVDFGAGYDELVVLFWTKGVDLAVGDVMWIDDVKIEGDSSTGEEPVSEVIIDNSDSIGITITGSWTTSSNVGGFYASNYLHDDNTGKGQKSVRYTPNLAAGTYDVYVRYTSDPNRASNVPINITHASGTDYVSLDQRKGGGEWVSLGTYAFSSGTSGNVLIGTAGTNGYVIADAVRFVPSSTEVIIDNSDSTGVTITGSWTSSSNVGGFYGSNYLHDDNTGKGQKSVRYTPNLAAGAYDVYVRYTSDANRASNVPVDITHANGTDCVSLDQRTGGGAWVLLGTYAFNSGTSGNVLIGNAGTVGFVVADAVRFVPSTISEVIVDNSDSTGVTITGSWSASSNVGGFYGSNYLHDDNSGKGQRSVRYTPNLAAGTYDVYVRYTSDPNRVSNVPIDITHSNGTASVSLDQRTGGGAWVLLGTYTFNSGTSGNVLISNTGTNGHVIADAVRFVKK